MPTQKHTLSINAARFSAECSCGWKLTGECDASTSAKVFSRQAERLHTLHLSAGPPLGKPKGRAIIGFAGPVVGRLNAPAKPKSKDKRK